MLVCVVNKYNKKKINKSEALGFQIELEFRNVGFCGGRKTRVPIIINLNLLTNILSYNVMVFQRVVININYIKLKVLTIELLNYMFLPMRMRRMRRINKLPAITEPRLH